MSLSPYQSHVLRQISEHLAVSDPWLARQLTGPRQPPSSAARESAVIAVLLGWLVLGFVPLGLGVALSLPVLIGAGVLTAFIGGPVMIWATLRWVRRHRFVRFKESGEQ
jgi:ABC-type Fe3+-siderophore transport system permease subunit